MLVPRFQYNMVFTVNLTHHFTVDFVKMYFADFVNYVFRMERHETKTYKNRKQNLKRFIK